MYRNHKNTRPPTRATAAPTTMIVMVVVLERLDDVGVCDGSGDTGVVVASEMGEVVMPEGRWVVDPGRGVVLAVAGVGVRVAAGADDTANPASAEKKAL